MTEQTCANCSAPLSGRGPKASVTGKRFCVKPKCQAARQREYRNALRGEEVEFDDRPCYHCGEALLPRPARVTDSEIGRWCQARPCQRDRRRRVGLDRRIEARQFDVVEMEEMAILFREAKEKRGRVRCPECGLADAVPGYSHPLPGGQGACRAVGREKLSADEAYWTWPELRP